MKKKLAPAATLCVLLAASMTLVACHDTPSTWGHHSGDYEETYTPGSTTPTPTPTPAPSLTFRASVSEVVAGDIAVSSGSTVKYVPVSAWDATAYSAYTPLGVCVNTSYMINLVNEDLEWADAISSYSSGDWTLTTVAQLQAIAGAKDTLNASLSMIGSAQLAARPYWSSQSGGSSMAWAVDLTDGHAFNTPVCPGYVRLVRALN